MSQCVVPSWNERNQRQGLELDQGKDGNKPSSRADLDLDLDLSLDHHHHHHQSFLQVVPMSNYEVTELTWENGQLGMHELGGIFPPPTSATPSPAKPTWAGATRAGDTLESIVHQATYCNKQSPNVMPEAQQEGPNMKRVDSFVASSGGKWAQNSSPKQTPGPPPHPSMMKKRTHSESEHWGRKNLSTSLGQQPNDHESTCASANDVSCRNHNDTTIWPSFESPRSYTRTKTTTDDDSTCHAGSENQEEERESKEETGRFYTIRRGRAVVVHNQSERIHKRRERINQKMKALQKLVPNASKTDKASMLDEVIEYLKELQAQVKMMSTARFMPQIMMPLGMQQHLHQMTLLARMGMGMGMGMGTGLGMGMGMGMGMFDTPPPSQQIPQLIHPTQVASATSAFVPPHFVIPHMIPTTQQSNPDPTAGSTATLQDHYSTLLAQSMNIDLYNRMAALQRQQQTQTQQTSNHMQFNNHVQGG